MGIYTSNRFFGEAYDYASEIPANEAYDAAFGCAHILADCQRNDMALFEGAIYDDINEVKAFHEGTGYVNENAFTNVIKKIVELFKKLLAKIKGIFKAFLAKLQGAFMDGKKLVQKYEKQIIKYSNWDGFKIKGIRIPKEENIRTAIDDMFGSDSTMMSNRYEISISNGNLINTKIPGIENEDKIDKAESEDIKLALANVYLSEDISDYNDIDKEIMDILFNESETLEDDKISGSYFSKSWIKTILIDGDKWQKDIKKFSDKLEKNINTVIDNLNKDDEKLAKFMIDNKDKKVAGFKNSEGTYSTTTAYGDADNNQKITKNNDSIVGHGSYGVDAKNVQKAIHALQKLAGNEQEVITKITSEYMSISKFTHSQARKIWTAAAAWSSSVHKESVEYYQALGEAASEEFYMNMEAVC